MTTITEDYVSFETANLLKEKGFNASCHAVYDTAVTGGKPKFSEYEVLSFFPYGMRNTDDKYGMVISAPTLQMAMKWLREVHNIMVSPYALSLGYYFEIFDLVNIDITGCKPLYKVGIPNKEDVLNTYKEAVEAAIKYCLEHLI